MANLNEFLFGSSDKLKKVPTGTPQQQTFHNSILQQLQQLMQQGGGYNQAQQYFQDLLGGSSDAYDKFSQPFLDRKSTRLNSSHSAKSRMPSSA